MRARGSLTVVSLPARMRGPTASANGGYTCGRVAREADGPVEVTLHAPPPLDTDLAWDGARLTHGDRLIASATPFSDTLTGIGTVGLGAAAEASQRYRCRHAHPLPECFVCGTGRADGLRIWPGPVEGGEGVAAAWVPDASVGDEAGSVPIEVLWAALDCPQYFGLGVEAPFMILGRMAAQVFRRPRVGEPCVVRGWQISHVGRKGVGAAALYSGGELLAASRGTWIEVDPARFGAS